MIIDTHVHESKYSADSSISLEEIIHCAKEIGLDGVCITDHDTNELRKERGVSFKQDEVLVIVGAEILTFQGDILVFGLEKLPNKMINASELLEMVKEVNGVAISAHPFRNNNRGLGQHIREVSHQSIGVEVLNGSTTSFGNLYAYALAMELNLGCFGASDAHVIQNLGKFATRFENTIRDEQDFIEAVKGRNFRPVVRKFNTFEDINI